MLFLTFIYLSLLAMGNIVLELSMPYQSSNPYGWNINGVFQFVIRYFLEMLQMGLLSLTAIHGIISWWITMALLFAVFPVTLRESKVRPAHLIRILCYSSFIPLCLMALWVLLIFASNWIFGIGTTFTVAINPWAWNWNWLYSGYFGDASPNIFIALLFAIWWGIWWARADSNYLHLHYWLIIWFCQMIVSCLITINMLYWMNCYGNEWLESLIYG